jgi:hypothetical protein
MLSWLNQGAWFSLMCAWSSQRARCWRAGPTVLLIRVWEERLCAADWQHVINNKHHNITYMQHFRLTAPLPPAGFRVVFMMPFPVVLCLPCPGPRSTPAIHCCTQQLRRAYSLRGQRRCQCRQHTHQRASALDAVRRKNKCSRRC